MRSKLFVFVVLPGKECIANTKMILEKLNQSSFSFEFILKENLASGRLDGVAFYITVLKGQETIDDYYEMALNFKMIPNKHPVNSYTFPQRFDNFKNIYSPADFQIALRILQTIEKFNNLFIYCFM